MFALGLERGRFLAEALRLLRPEGYLGIYNNASMAGCMRERTLRRGTGKTTRYPSPPRSSAPFGPDEATQHGLRWLAREDYLNDFAFTLDELVAYLMTQSNVIAALEGDQESTEEVRAWLSAEMAPFFEAARGTFVFGGYIWYLQNSE